MSIARIQFEGLNPWELANYERYLIDHLKMVRHQIQRQERQGNNSDSSDNEDRRPSEDDHIVSAYNTTAYQEDSTEECQYQCYNDGRRHANEECQYDFGQPDEDDDHDSDDN